MRDLLIIIAIILIIGWIVGAFILVLGNLIHLLLLLAIITLMLGVIRRRPRMYRE